jgi:hypothetical protein
MLCVLIVAGVIIPAQRPRPAYLYGCAYGSSGAPACPLIIEQ